VCPQLGILSFGINIMLRSDILLTLITAALMSRTSRGLSWTIYWDVWSSLPSHAMVPNRAGASWSGKEEVEVLLCRLSVEDLGLSVCIDMI
jgi:hypothetical protein